MHAIKSINTVNDNVYSGQSGQHSDILSSTINVSVVITTRAKLLATANDNNNLQICSVRGSYTYDISPNTSSKSLQIKNHACHVQIYLTLRLINTFAINIYINITY